MTAVSGPTAAVSPSWRRSDSLPTRPLWSECFGDAGIMEDAFEVGLSSSPKQELKCPKDKRRRA
ncbi:hypothetical protein T4D_5555 [Trichinella pseudospiralis]|uniref:Uncharacterized protein n=1 Tax=Trichinella pseudospiralis TaxID=6337 RepID=A0A0V1FTH5_TRIPS|nr:hypothetical protein T4D_17192 [Trichinella pseudospiralis]KRY90422.1 hypothetical protein T4D_5555 [Trichinella pseudospiralis]